MRGTLGLLVMLTAVAGVGCSESGNEGQCGAVVAHAEVDLAPLRSDCSADPAICPAPYQCLTYNYYVGLSPEPDGGLVERTLCEVPCADDRDCPEGFFCQGQCQQAEAGLPAGYCLEDV